jgi:hypothetical protein
MTTRDDGVTATGGCLCGSVRYEISGKLRPVIACHCTQCRRQTGHFMAATAAQREHFRLVSDADLRWYEASDVARRGFCARCGSTLFWSGNASSYVSIAAGTVDGNSGVKTAVHIHVADKGDYYEIGDGVPQIADGDFSGFVPASP